VRNKSLLILFVIFINVFLVACRADSEDRINPITPAAANSSLPVDSSSLSSASPQLLEKVPVRLASQSFNIMLARNAAQRTKGLMFYNSLEKNEGMLFVYPYPRKMTFWMMNTLIPLDLVFFSDNLQITEWIENMKPGNGLSSENLPRYSSIMSAQYALELPAGSVKSYGLKVGDYLEIPLTLLYAE
jgi:hypothetical protein